MATPLQLPASDAARQSAEQPLPTIGRPLHVRSTSIAILAFMAVVVFLHWAQAVLIPITFAVLLSYALTPVIDWLKGNVKLPKVIGAALVLVLILGGLGGGLSTLQPEALDILDLVPRATQKFNLTVRGNPRSAPGAVAKIQKAATEIEKVANTAGAPAATVATAPVKPGSEAAAKIRDYLLMGTVSVAAGIGQLIVVAALVYFLLIAGDAFRRTLVRINGDTLTKKKVTVQVLDEIDRQIQRYLLVQIATSALLGIVAWGVFASMGLDNAITWACVGGVLHLIPYAGPAAFVALIALVAYVQFDTVQPVLVLVGSIGASLGVIGLLLVPWLTQKVGSLNAVTVFVALLVWGWLWGIWGLLLGIPITMAVKAVCDRVEDLRPISAFLGTPTPDETTWRTAVNPQPEADQVAAPR
jgi:predicted PurR-regulated permease PerM